MTVRLDHKTIRLEGDCHVEDAEPLLSLLQEADGRAVDVSALGAIHTAVLQVLLAFRPKIAQGNGDSFFNSWIMPLLAKAGNE
jgi:ABC-type transporter Mla MlaB component